jgi:hypothetical protein
VTTHGPPSTDLGLLGRVVDATGDLRLIGLMRAAFGLIVIVHFWPDVTVDRLPVERFHEPWWGWWPVPGPALYRTLLWTGVFAGALMLFGVLARAATAAAFMLVLYLLIVDLGGFGHNRAFLTWMLFGLALLPSDCAWSVPALLARRRGVPLDTIGFTWPVVMLRVIASGVYLASGVTKLLDSAWRSGLVLWDRTVRFEHNIPVVFDGWIHEMLTSRWFHRVLSPAAIATELFLAVGLWFPRTRRVALVVAIAFHLSIEITARVQTFSYSALAALLIWLVPTGVVTHSRPAPPRRDHSLLA